MKPERWAAVGDTHGDMIDPAARDAFFDFVKWFKPTQRLHLGDAFDFRCLRSKASDEERRDGLRDDIDAGCDFLSRLRPTVWLMGNHDVRLTKLLDADDRKLADLAAPIWDDIEEAASGAMILPYDKRRGVHRYGDVSFVHGYAAGIGATRAMTMVYGNVEHGHTHHVETVTVPGVTPKVGRSIGCLCKLDMDYNAASMLTLRQKHGWSYGVKVGNRLVRWQAERIGSQWVYAEPKAA